MIIGRIENIPNTQMIKQEHTSTCHNIEDPSDILRKSNNVLSELNSMTPFEKMTVHQKRVALAKDVLMQLNIGKYNPQGTYLSVYEKFKHSASPIVDSDLLQEMKNNNTYCAVCAIGGLFVSHVVKKRCKGIDIDSLTYLCMIEDLREIFSKDDLMIIEGLFENWVRYVLDENVLNTFNDNFKTRREKMIGIMQNLINNEGRLIINDETLIK